MNFIFSLTISNLNCTVFVSLAHIYIYIYTADVVSLDLHEGAKRTNKNIGNIGTGHVWGLKDERERERDREREREREIDR